jgi:hypothetical protein
MKTEIYSIHVTDFEGVQKIIREVINNYSRIDG